MVDVRVSREQLAQSVPPGPIRKAAGHSFEVVDSVEAAIAVLVRWGAVPSGFAVQ
jgi:hypothetical protein